MSWDWKKAIDASLDSSVTALLGTGSSRRSPGGTKGQALPPDMQRTASIAWRTAARGSGLPGGSIDLIDECEHECPFCHGRGKFAQGSICPICNGRKTVHVEPPSVRCAFCGGRGQMPPHSNLSCWVCSGKGLIAVRPPVQTCPDCQGKGRKRGKSLYCPRCRGVGVVTFKDVMTAAGRAGRR